jgi:hypothetical protein
MRSHVKRFHFAVAAGGLAVLLAVSPSAIVLADEPSPADGAAPAKRLHTIPEDDFSRERSIALTPAVSKILETRASEDLVICVAGCSPGRDIVVYAQPTNKTAEAVSPGPLTSEAAPAAMPPANSDANAPAADMASPAAVDGDGTPETAEAAEAGSGSDAATETGRFEPTAATGADTSESRKDSAVDPAEASVEAEGQPSDFNDDLAPPQ